MCKLEPRPRGGALLSGGRGARRRPGHPGANSAAIAAVRAAGYRAAPVRRRRAAAWCIANKLRGRRAGRAQEKYPARPRAPHARPPRAAARGRSLYNARPLPRLSFSLCCSSRTEARLYPSLYNNGCQARRIRGLRGSGARHGAARRARHAVAAAGGGEARRRVPEDSVGAVERARQQQEHAGRQQGAQGGLRLRAAAAVAALHQPAGRHQRRERQGQGGAGDVARQHREGGRRPAQGAPRGGAAGRPAARPPAGRRAVRRAGIAEARQGGRRARRRHQREARAADQAGLRRLHQAGRGRAEEAARGRHQAVSAAALPPPPPRTPPHPPACPTINT